MDIQNTDADTLGEEIKVVLAKYLKDRPCQSVTGLANDKVGKTTLHKIYTGSNQIPTERTVAGIVLEMNKDKSWDEIVNIYKDYPKLHNCLQQYVSKHYQATSEFALTSSDYEDTLKDEGLFRAIIMSQADNGVSKKQLERLFGFEVIRSIEKLVAKEILIEKDGFIFSTNEDINAAQDTVHKLANNLLKKCYNLEDFGTGINNELRIEYRTDVNKDFLMPLISKKLIRITTEIRELLDDPRAKGSDTVWCVVAMDNLLKNMTLNGQVKETLQ